MASVLLASRSPRRRALLENVGFDVVVAAADVDETPGPREPAVDFARRLAGEKAAAVARAPADGTPRLGFAADTVVWLDAAEPLGKPEDAAHAARILRELSGRTHTVTTAVAIFDPAAARVARVIDVSTRVVFRALSDAEIDGYVATGEPLDKAGAYGVQGRGGALVESLDGCFLNVMGLPLLHVLAAAREEGLLPGLPWARS